MRICSVKGCATGGGSRTVERVCGADLNRMASELDKLVLSLPEGEKQISIELVQRHIGISKNYNIFELQDAIGCKDVLKVNRIVKYFDENEKDNPIQRTLASLFKYFANLMVAFYAPTKTKQGIAIWLGLTEWQVEKMCCLPCVAIRE